MYDRFFHRHDRHRFKLPSWRGVLCGNDASFPSSPPSAPGLPGAPCCRSNDHGRLLHHMRRPLWDCRSFGDSCRRGRLLRGLPIRVRNDHRGANDSPHYAPGLSRRSFVWGSKEWWGRGGGRVYREKKMHDQKGYKPRLKFMSAPFFCISIRISRDISPPPWKALLTVSRAF